MDKTKKFNDEIYLASDSFRVDIRLPNEATETIVVCKYPRRRRLQICDKIGHRIIEFQAMWL